MSKYYLVASYYNTYTKKYENETIVKIPGIDLSTIQAIDNFTSSHNRTEIINLIPKEGIERSKYNHLAIKYYKTKNSSPIYYKTIENNLLFQKCTKNLIPKKYNIRGKVISALTIPETKLLLMEKAKLLRIIETKNKEEFKKIYTYDNLFSKLVIDYIESIYDEQAAEQQDLQLILTEFSRYKTFRGWITSQEKYSKNYKLNNITEKRPKPTDPSNNIKSKPISPKSVKEHENNYVKSFEQKNNISYQAYQAFTHNTAYIEAEDKEEFIEPNEVYDMYNYGEEENDDHTYIKKRK